MIATSATSTLGLNAPLETPVEEGTPSVSWFERLRGVASTVGNLALGHAPKEDIFDDLPILEMARFESRIEGLESPTREHLRVVGQNLTLCGADSRTWASYPDGRLLPGKECSICVQRAYSPLGVGEPEVTLVN